MTELNTDIEQTVSTDATGDVQQEIAPETQEMLDKIADLSDKYLRAAAEVENTRRRCELNAQNMARGRAMGIAENFLPLIDAIDAARKHAPDDAGMIAMAATANGVLAQSGITRIETVGAKLNPAFHNAVSTESAKDAEPNTITAELQSGYMFGDTVLRAAMVVVAQ
jgi:molecular chaperone GrpE